MEPHVCFPRFSSSPAYSKGRQKISSVLVRFTESSRPVISCSRSRISASLQTAQQDCGKNCPSCLLRGCRPRHCSGRQRRDAFAEATRFLCAVVDTSPSLRFAALSSVHARSGFYVPAVPAATAPAAVVASGTDAAVATATVARCVSATGAAPTCAALAADGASASVPRALAACAAPNFCATSAAASSPAASVAGGLFRSFSTIRRPTCHTGSQGARTQQPAAAAADAPPGASAAPNTSVSSSSSHPSASCSPVSLVSSSSSPSAPSHSPEEKEEHEGGSCQGGAGCRTGTFEDLRGVDFYTGARPLSPFRQGKPVSHDAFNFSLLFPSSNSAPSPASSSSISPLEPPQPLLSPSTCSSSTFSSSSSFPARFGPPFAAASPAERMRRVDVDLAAWQQEAAAEQQFEDEGWHLFVTSTCSPTAHILTRQRGTGSAYIREPPYVAAGGQVAETKPWHFRKLPSVTDRESASEMGAAYSEERSAAQTQPLGSAFNERRRRAERNGGEQETVATKEGRPAGGGSGCNGERKRAAEEATKGRKRRSAAAVLRGRRGSAAGGKTGESATAVGRNGVATAREEDACGATAALERRGNRAAGGEQLAAAGAAEKKPQHYGSTKTATAAAPCIPAVSALPRDFNHAAVRSSERENEWLLPVQREKRRESDPRWLQVTEPQEETRARVEETRKEEEAVVVYPATAGRVGARWRRAQDAEEDASRSAKHECDSSKGRRRQQQQSASTGTCTLLDEGRMSTGQAVRCAGETAAACKVLRSPTPCTPSTTASSNSSSSFLPADKELKLSDSRSGSNSTKEGRASEYRDSSSGRTAGGLSCCSRAGGSRSAAALRRAYSSNSSSRRETDAGSRASSTRPRSNYSDRESLERYDSSSKATSSNSSSTSGLGRRSSSSKSGGTRQASSSKDSVAGKSSGSCWERQSSCTVSSSSAIASPARCKTSNLPSSAPPFAGSTAPSHTRRNKSSFGLTVLDIPPPPLTYFDMMNKLDGDCPHPETAAASARWTAKEMGKTREGDARTTDELDEAAPNATAATRTNRSETTDIEEFFPALPKPRALSSFFTDGRNDWRYHLTREDDMLHAASSTESSCSLQQQRCYDTPWSPAAPPPPAAAKASFAADRSRKGAETATAMPRAALTHTGDRNLCVFIPSLGRWKPIALLSAQQLLHALQQPAASLGNSESRGFYRWRTRNNDVYFSRGDPDTRLLEVPSPELLHLQLQHQHSQQLQQQNQSMQLLGMSTAPHVSVAPPVSSTSHHLPAATPMIWGSHALPAHSFACASRTVSPNFSATHLSPPSSPSPIPPSNSFWPFSPVPLEKDSFFPLCYWRELLKRLQRIAFSFNTSSFLAVVFAVYVHLQRVRAAILHTQHTLDRRMSLCSFWSQHASAAASAAEHAAAAAEAAGVEAKAAAEAAAAEAAAAEAAAAEAAAAEAAECAGILTHTVVAEETAAAAEAAAAASEAAVSTKAARAAEAAAAAKAARTAASAAAEAARKVEEEQKTPVKQLQDQVDVLTSCYFILAQQPLWKCLGDNLLPHLPFLSLSDLAALAEAFTAVGPEHASVTSVLALQATDKLHELHLHGEKAMQQQQKRAAQAATTAASPFAAAGGRAAAPAGGAAGSIVGAVQTSSVSSPAAPSLPSCVAAADQWIGAAGTSTAAGVLPRGSDSLAIPVLLHLLDVFSEGAYAAAGVSVSPWSLPSLSSFASCTGSSSRFSSAWNAESCCQFFEQNEDAECNEEAAGTTQILAQQLLARTIALLQQHDTKPPASSILTRSQQVQLATHAGLHWYHLPATCRAYVHRVLDNLLFATEVQQQTSCAGSLAPLEVLSLLAAAAPGSLRSPSAPLLPIHRFLRLEQPSAQLQQRQQHLQQVNSSQQQQDLHQQQQQQQLQQQQPCQLQHSIVLQQLEVQRPHCPSDSAQLQHFPHADVWQQQAFSFALCPVAPSLFTLPLPRGAERFLLREVSHPAASSPLARREPRGRETSLKLQCASAQHSCSSASSLSSVSSLRSATVSSSSSSSSSFTELSNAVTDNAEATASAAIRYENAAMPLLPLLAPSPLKAWNHSSGFSHRIGPFPHSYSYTALSSAFPSCRVRACAMVSLKQLSALLDGSTCASAIALPSSSTSFLPFFTNCTLLRLAHRSNKSFGGPETGGSRFPNAHAERPFVQETGFAGAAAQLHPSSGCAYAPIGTAVELVDCWISLPVENVAAASSSATSLLSVLGQKATQSSSCKTTEGEESSGFPTSRHLPSHHRELRRGSWQGYAASEEDEEGEDLAWDTSLSLGEAERFSYLQRTLSPSSSSSFPSSSGSFSAFASTAAASSSYSPAGASVFNTLVPAALLLTVQRSLSRFTLLLGDSSPLPMAAVTPSAAAPPSTGVAAAAGALPATVLAAKIASTAAASAVAVTEEGAATASAATATAREDHAASPGSTLGRGESRTVRGARGVQTTKNGEENQKENPPVTKEERRRRCEDESVEEDREEPRARDHLSSTGTGGSGTQGSSPCIGSRALPMRNNSSSSNQNSSLVSERTSDNSVHKNRNSGAISMDSNTCDKPVSDNGGSRNSSRRIGSTAMRGGSGGTAHTDRRSGVDNSISNSIHSIDQDTLFKVQSYTCRLLSLLAHAMCSQWPPTVSSSSLLHALHSHVDALLVAVAVYATAKRGDDRSGDRERALLNTHIAADGEGGPAEFRAEDNRSTSALEQKEKIAEQQQQRVSGHGQHPDEEEKQQQLQDQQQEQLQQQHQRQEQSKQEHQQQQLEQHRVQPFSESGGVSRGNSEEGSLGAEALESLFTSKYEPNTFCRGTAVERASGRGEQRLRRRTVAQDVDDSSEIGVNVSNQQRAVECSNGSTSKSLADEDWCSPSVTPGKGRSNSSDRSSDTANLDAATVALESVERSKTCAGAGSAEKAEERARATLPRDDLRKLREEAAACLAIHLYSVSFLLRHITLQARGSAAAAPEGRLQQRESGQCNSSSVSSFQILSSSSCSAAAAAEERASQKAAGRAAAAPGSTAGDVRGVGAAAAAGSQTLQQQQEEEDEQQQQGGGGRGRCSMFEEPPSVSGCCSADQALDYVLPPAVEVLLSSVSRATEALLNIDDSGWTCDDKTVERAKDVFYFAALECLAALRGFLTNGVWPATETQPQDVLQRFCPSHLAAWLRCLTLLLTGTTPADQSSGLLDSRCLQYHAALRESAAFLFVIGSCAKEKLQQSAQLAAAGAVDSKATLCLFESLARLFHHLSTLRVPQGSTPLDRKQPSNSLFLRKKKVDGEILSVPTLTGKAASCTHSNDENVGGTTPRAKSLGVRSCNEKISINTSVAENVVVPNVASDAANSLKEIVDLITTELTSWLPYSGDQEQARVQKAVQCFNEARRRWEAWEIDKKAQLFERHSTNIHPEHRTEGDGLYTLTYPYYDKGRLFDEMRHQHFREQELRRRNNFNPFVSQEFRPGTPIMEAITEAVLWSVPLKKVLSALKRARKQKGNPTMAREIPLSKL